MKGALKIVSLAFTVLCAQATDPVVVSATTTSATPATPAPEAETSAFAETAATDPEWTMVMRVSINFDPATDTAKSNAFKTGVVTALHLPDGVTGANVHFAFAEVVVAAAETESDAGHRRLSDTVYDVTVTIGTGVTQCVTAAAEPAADSHRRLTAAVEGSCLAIPDKTNIDTAIEAAFTAASVTATVDVTHAAETHMELESNAHLGASLSAAVMTVLLVASRG